MTFNSISCGTISNASSSMKVMSRKSPGETLMLNLITTSSFNKTRPLRMQFLIFVLDTSEINSDKAISIL